MEHMEKDMEDIEKDMKGIDKEKEVMEKGLEDMDKYMEDIDKVMEDIDMAGVYNLPEFPRINYGKLSKKVWKLTDSAKQCILFYIHYKLS